MPPHGLKPLRLTRSSLRPDPFVQFKLWYDETLAADILEPTAMTLGTVSRDGAPSTRVVLLKDHGPAGFIFFSNYRSQKGRELQENPRASLLFHWPHAQRQIRIVGAASQTTREVSEAYFWSRPRGSQLGAWASEQSEPVRNRERLEERLKEVEERFKDVERVPLPPFWGGYCVQPDSFEFWQAGEFRLHDRFRYSKEPDASWTIERLCP